MTKVGPLLCLLNEIANACNEKHFYFHKPTPTCDAVLRLLVCYATRRLTGNRSIN